MGVHTARIPENLEEYLKIVMKKGYATSYGNAINLIILDRMMRDKEAGDVAPFKYKLRDARVTSSLQVSELGTENVEEPATFPLGEAPPIAGPLPAPSGGLSLPATETDKREIVENSAVRSESSEASGDSAKYWGGPVKVDYSSLSEEELKQFLDEHSEFKKYVKNE